MTDITEADIQSYIDRQADRDTWTRVEECMAKQPALSVRVRESREDMAQLSRYFDDLEAQIPDRHMEETVSLVVRHAPQRRLANVPIALRVAAMFVLLVVGSAGVLGIKLSMTVPAFADAGALAYLDVARHQPSAKETLPADPQWLVDWLNNKTGLLIRVPYSEQHGFRLTDGRLTEFDRHAAGLLVYEDERKHRVVIFVTRITENDDPTPHSAIDRATHINYWSRNGIGVVVAAADAGDLKKFTEATQKMIDVSAVSALLAPR